MTAVILEVLAIVALVVLNGVLSMSEAAVIASRKPLLGALAKEGRRNAHVALSLAREPGAFLSTVQVGITLQSRFSRFPVDSFKVQNMYIVPFGGVGGKSQ